MTSVPFLDEDVRLFMANNPSILIMCLIAAITIQCAIFCNKSLSRQVPNNYYLLGGFTFCEAYLVANVTTIYDPEIVLQAAIITAGMVTGLSIFATTTHKDFTIGRGVLCVFGSALLMTLLMALMFSGVYTFLLF